MDVFLCWKTLARRAPSLATPSVALRHPGRRAGAGQDRENLFRAAKPDSRATTGHENGLDHSPRYENYTGRFVLHCHILTHEDLGMMALVEIKPGKPPGEQGEDRTRCLSPEWARL